MITFRITLLVTLLATTLPAIQEPIAVDGGKIVGIDAAREGVRAYLGIPFAAPPVGELRWRAPQAVEPWEGVRKCDAFGPACPQPPGQSVARTPRDQDEDCLHLNVWTAARSADERRPVMVWIHGGGNTIGWSGQSFYEGHNLAAEGVVLVSINYRLGPFGYLAHPALTAESDERVSGNYGTQDQIAALKWVRRNIARFGGDPDNVTIFGESAGSVNCVILSVSPRAKGLFRRAIMQSGVPTHVQQRLDEAERHGASLLERLGAKTIDDARRLTPAQILKAERVKVGLMGKGTQYNPIIDGVYLPNYPPSMLAAGEFHVEAIMAGSNADESTLFNRARVPKREFGYKMIVRQYFKDRADRALELAPVEDFDAPHNAFDHIMGVMSFVAPTRFLVQSVSKDRPDTYLYHFTRVSPDGRRSGLGATHGVEIAYVFGTSDRILRDPVDRRLADQMRSRWVAFATNGSPQVEGQPEWPRYTTESDQHLEFGDTVRTGSKLHKGLCDLWEEMSRETRKEFE